MGTLGSVYAAHPAAARHCGGRVQSAPAQPWRVSPREHDHEFGDLARAGFRPLHRADPVEHRIAIGAGKAFGLAVCRKRFCEGLGDRGRTCRGIGCFPVPVGPGPLDLRKAARLHLPRSGELDSALLAMSK